MKLFIKYVFVYIVCFCLVLASIYIFSVGIEKNLYPFYFVGTFGLITSLVAFWILLSDIESYEL